MPSAAASYSLGQTTEDPASEELNLWTRSMALISMVVTSVVPWPPYRFSDDQVLELVNITAAFENDSEGAASGMVWVQIVEPQELAKVQPEG